MADATSRIRILFDGAVDGLRRAVREAESDLNRLNDGLERNRQHLETFNRVGDGVGRTVASMSKAFLSLGGAASAIQGVVVVAGTLASVTTELAPAALALPGIFLGIGVAVGTAKLALEGVSEAIKGDAEALAQLSPAARDSVKAIQGLADGFNKMKSAVQEDFFAGLAFDIKATGAELLRVGTIYLPEVASGFNAMAVEALRAARAPKFLADLGVIAENTAIGLGNMKNVLANVISGFVGLGAVGSKFLPAIGKAIDDVARKFNDWVQNGINDGSIERMIDRALQGFRDLGTVFANVFSTGASAFEAFNRGLGGEAGTIASLKAASAAMLGFVNQPEVQAGLQALGETVRVLSDTFRTVLAAAIRELGPIFQAVAPFIQEVIRQLGGALVAAINTVGPILHGLATFLSENKDVIAPLVPLLIPLAVGFKAVGLAIAAIKGLAALSAAFTALQAATAGGLAARLTAIGAALARILLPVAAAAGLALAAKYVDELNIAAAGGNPENLTGMADSLHNLVGAGEQLASGDFAGIFADIGSEWDMMIQKFQAGESPAGAAFQKISQSFQTDFLDVFAQAPAQIGGFFSSLPGIIGGALSTLGSAIATAAQPVIDFFANLPTLIGTALGDLGSFFVTKATEIWNSFLSGCTTAFAPVLAFFQQTPAQMGFAIGAAIGDFIQSAINLWNAFLTGCKQGVAIVVAFASQVPGMIGAAVASLVGLLVSWATSAWNGAKTATTTAVNAVVTFCSTLPDRIMNVINDLISLATNWARTTWEGVKTTTTTIVTAVITFVGQLPGKIMAFLSSLPGQLRTNATNSWESFKQGVITKANEVITFVRNIPGQIMNVLGDLGSLLISRGRAIIDGLLAGIRAGVQAMYDFVSGIAAGIAARKGPIEKDRVLLKPAGLALMQGLQGGLETGASKVLTFVSGLGPAMAAALGGTQLGSFEAAQLARVQSQSAARGLLGTAVNQVSAVASREQPAPVTNVTVLLSREQIAEIARVVVDNSQRETARKVTAGFGTTF